MPLKRTGQKKYRLPGKAIHSLDEFYNEISRKLLFPGHFGRNLDALWDVLRTDIEGPVFLVWEDSAISKVSMGKDFEKITALLKEVEKERDDFHVSFL
jgi:ribonuclease inhibitor